MTYAELTRKLRRLGVEFRRQGDGSHEIWWDPRKRLYTVITHHAGREIPNGTRRKILKDSGLTEDDLNNA